MIDELVSTLCRDIYHSPADHGNTPLVRRVHHIYRDGLRNEGHVLGHWGADWREFGDEVGARSMFARVTWEPTFGTLETSYRQLANEDYGVGAYETATQIDARYSRPWDQVFVGAELTIGRDVFGDSYSRLGAFIRF